MKRKTKELKEKKKKDKKEKREWSIQDYVSLYLICGASGPAYLNSRILRGIFDKVNGSPVVPQ